MRITIRIFLLLIFFSANAQITQLYTGTTVTLNHLSCIGNTVFVGGQTGNYLAKSYNEGFTLTPVICPGSSTNNITIQRLDKDTIFLLSHGFNAELYRSTDGAANWSLRMDTTIFVPNSMAFFNSYEGIVDYGYGDQILRTLNGGSAWTLTTTPFDYVTIFKTYGDSLVIGGGIGTNAVGYFLMSKDRGHTWPIASGLGGQGGLPIDFCFLNSDTIFGISSQNNSGKSYFTKTTNSGQNWESSLAPLKNNFGVTARKGNDIFVVGSDDQNKGIIAKTDNLGQSWTQLNTGISCKLHNLIFLNDSIALLSGTNGVLLRWNYKTSILSGLSESALADAYIHVFPNPTNTDFLIETNLIGFKRITVTDIKGVIVQKFQSSERRIKVDVSQYQSGVYFISISSDRETIVAKVIKN